ncbi:MAG: hypothetical protein R3350_01625 [Saprospiraceae bacterium]|nr:hypothetical protein [Saprospiraceae bacterium]
MKPFLLLVFLTAFAFQTFGQDTIDQLAKESCECTAAKNLDELDSNQLNMELGLCIMDALDSLDPDSRSELNVDITDPVGMRKLGEKIGLKMASICPDLMMKIAQVETKADINPVQELRGTLRGIEGNEFSFLIVEDQTGRKQRYLWFHYFEGSEKLIEDPLGVIGKKVIITFETVEGFSPQLKDYYTLKEVRSLEFVEE